MNAKANSRQSVGYRKRTKEHKPTQDNPSDKLPSRLQKLYEARRIQNPKLPVVKSGKLQKGLTSSLKNVQKRSKTGQEN